MGTWSYGRTVLAASTAAFFATMVARLAISPVVPAIGTSLSVSNAAIGLALSGMWLTYALAQFPSGLLGDRIGERRVIVVAVGGTAVASLGIVLAPIYPVFVVAVVMLGAVAGLHYSPATTLLTRTLPNTGSAIGVHSAGAPIAGLLAPTLAGIVGARYGWRPAVAIGVLVAAPVAVAFAWSVRPVEPTRPDEAIRDRIELAPLLEVLTRPAIALTTGLAVCGAFVWQSTSSFLPAFLIQYHGYSEPAAGAMFSVYFAVQGVGQPAIGSLSDRIGRYPAAAVAVGAGVVGYGLFVAATGWWQLLAAAVLAGVAMSWGAALLPNIMDHLTEAERGIGFGLIRTTYMVLGASGSLVTGWLSERFGWQSAFLLLTGLLGGVLVVLIGWLVRARLRTPPAGTPESGD